MFRVLIANFARHTVRLKAGQTVDIASHHPTAMAEADISHAGLLGITTNNTNYSKWQVDVKDINTINEQFPDNRESHTLNDRKPVTAVTIELSVDEKYEPRIRKMLKTQRPMFRPDW